MAALLAARRGVPDPVVEIYDTLPRRSAHAVSTGVRRAILAAVPNADVIIHRTRSELEFQADR